MEGFRGRALELDGRDDHVDLGNPIALRLMGSLTISAWINPASFPRDDAAIVSALTPSFQLDTTIDRGPRTIGFKLIDLCGNAIGRYGRTPLNRDAWYHVAGVYDADTRALDVYLNGRPDNGPLSGVIPAAQQASADHVFVGRRADHRGYEFSGRIDDVRIYSKALTPSEVEADMHGGPVTGAASALSTSRADDVVRRNRSEGRGTCHQPTRPDDATAPGWMVALGMFAAIACAGFAPRRTLLALAASLLVGLLVLPAARFVLPSYDLWLLPLLGLAGGVAVIASIRDP